MSNPIVQLEQAYFLRTRTGTDREAHSAGFGEEWLSQAEAFCVGFGERKPGLRCPEVVFAKLLDRRHVAIVQVSDLEHEGPPEHWGLRFYFVTMPRKLYQLTGGDPFFLADEFPASWGRKGELSTLEWECEAAPYRTVAMVQRVLQREDGPNLLGGAQLLVDGGKLVFERPEPNLTALRDLWILLPTSTRYELWPASFAFDNTLGFDALVVPSAIGPAYTGYWKDEQAGDYPEGRYELNLQIAAEAADQHGLDAVLARRSRAETWKLGICLLLLLIGVVVISALLTPRPAQPEPQEPVKKARQ